MHAIFVAGFMEFPSRHQCFIYEGAPSKQLPALATVMQRKLNEGFRCIYLNSRPMVAGMRSTLAAMGTDVTKEIAENRLVLSSEPATSPDGNFDIDLMLNKLESAVDQALADGYKGLFATGDMTWEFGPTRNFAKLMEYEWRLEKLIRKREALCGICQYHHDTLPHEATRQALLTHQTIFINETLSRINPHYLSSGMANAQMTENFQLDEMIVGLFTLQTMASIGGERDLTEDHVAEKNF